jgi:hypothetical protein
LEFKTLPFVDVFLGFLQLLNRFIIPVSKYTISDYEALYRCHDYRKDIPDVVWGL